MTKRVVTFVSAIAAALFLTQNVIAQTRAIEFRKIIEEKPPLELAESDPGIFFKYPYWFILSEAIAFVPDDWLFIAKGKLKHVAYQITTQHVGEKQETSEMNYGFFNEGGKLIGKAFYSDGEYYFRRFLYDSELRLVAQTDSRENHREPYRVLRFAYKKQKGPMCLIDENGRRRIQVRESDSSGLTVYNSDAGSSLSVKSFDGRLEGIYYVLHLPKMTVKEQKEVLFEKGSISHYEDSFVEQDGSKKTELIEQYTNGLDGRLQGIVVTDPRDSSQNAKAKVTRYDKLGNWVTLSFIKESGDSVVFSREIGYFDEGGLANSIIEVIKDRLRFPKK